MKTNKDKILKYLSGLMTDDERIKFEEEISASPGVKEELNRIKMALADFNISEDILDERYFAGLIPKVRRKLDKLTEPSSLRKLYYLVPTVTAAVIGGIFLFRPTTDFETHYKELANQVVNNFSDQEVSRKYFDETDVDPSTLEAVIEDDNTSALVPTGVELNDEIASKYLNGSVVEDYSTLRGLSENELQQIADNLNSIKVK